tara:strand:- start:83 stop:373 length:291 start_codon:yes stop_codon:yes gene_type:complete
MLPTKMMEMNMKLTTLSALELNTLADVDREIRATLEGNDEIEITSHFGTATLDTSQPNIHVTLHGVNLDINKDALPESVDGYQIIYTQIQPEVITA